MQPRLKTAQLAAFHVQSLLAVAVRLVQDLHPATVQMEVTVRTTTTTEVKAEAAEETLVQPAHLPVAKAATEETPQQAEVAEALPEVEEVVVVEATLLKSQQE